MNAEQAAQLLDLLALVLAFQVLGLGLFVFAFGVWQVSR